MEATLDNKMAKYAFNELWIDGFNLFYKWSRTRDLFKPGCDIQLAQQESIRLLATSLNSKRNRCILFMDGGPEPTSMTLHGLRIKYPGSGQKADSLLEEFARGRTSNQRVLAVTSDRALAATLRRNRVQIIDSNKFIRDFLNNTSSRQHNQPEIKPEITDPAEVEEWIRIFSEDEDSK